MFSTIQKMYEMYRSHFHTQISTESLAALEEVCHTVKVINLIVSQHLMRKIRKTMVFNGIS